MWNNLKKFPAIPIQHIHWNLTLMSVLPENQVWQLNIAAITEQNKSMLGYVAPIGRPRSVYKSNVECCFLKFTVQMAK